METCDLCGEQMDDWECCPECGSMLCWACVDAGEACPCGCPLWDEED